jgi:protein-S-isoprenylcysteine O-methyltransferase Ste14
MNDYLFLFLSWSIYFFLHSLLASTGAKSKFPLSAKNYRLLYSIVSTIGLFWLMLQMAVIKPDYLFTPTDLTKYLGMVIASWGVIIIMMSFRQISAAAFLGLKLELNAELIKTGIHARMRHPIYTGTILVILGMLVAVPNYSVLVSAIASFLYLPIGIYLEEKKLISLFGKEYLEYKQEVKAILPGVI